MGNSRITQEGAVAGAVAAGTVATVLALAYSYSAKRDERTPEPPATASTPAAVVRTAGQGPVTAYPECTVVPAPLEPCVTVGPPAYLAFPDGSAIPAITDRTEVRDGVRWVVIR